MSGIAQPHHAFRPFSRTSYGLNCSRLEGGQLSLVCNFVTPVVGSVGNANPIGQNYYCVRPPNPQTAHRYAIFLALATVMVMTDTQEFNDNRSSLLA